jgi:hypothetical protein
MVRATSVLIVACLLTACDREDPARVSMHARLKQERRLTPDEIRGFFDQIAPAVTDKKVSVKEGAIIRGLNADERTSVLGMLRDPEFGV